MNERKRILLICGSMNQTTQMHAVAQQLNPYECVFTPYCCDGVLEILRRVGLLEYTVIGERLAQRCWTYLQDHGLSIDYGGQRQPYDLVLACSDIYLPSNLRGTPMVLVQEGITDPETFVFRLVQRLPVLPRWLAGTAATGLSDAYTKFCVASAGYRDLFIRKGVNPDKIEITGIPNFDDCHRYHNNNFPLQGYVLACTSPLRETMRREDRPAFIRKVVNIADGRPIIFKLHPNEKVERACREIAEHAPNAVVFDNGSAEEMIANCDELITRFSSTAFVGIALGKPTHSDVDMEELHRLLPAQHGMAAARIADVCRDILA